MGISNLAKDYIQGSFRRYLRITALDLIFKNCSAGNNIGCEANVNEESVEGVPLSSIPVISKWRER